MKELFRVIFTCIFEMKAKERKYKKNIEKSKGL